MRTKLKNRLIILLLFFALLLVVIPVCKYRQTADVSGRFQAFTDKLFLDEMLANTLNMHYTLADPEEYGITAYEPILPPYAYPSSDEYQDTIDALNRFDDTKLTDSQKRLKSLLSKHLVLSKEQSSYALYDNPLSPHSGIQSKVPTLFADYPFRTLQDAEDYLALLSQIPDYIQSVISFQDEKNAAGFLMPEIYRKLLVDQCLTILTKRELKEGSHFLQTTFSEKIDALAKKESLSAETVSYLTAQNTSILLQQILPSYQALIAYLQDIQTDSCKPAGLSTLPNGNLYYESLLKSEVGTYKSVSQLRSLLEAQFRAERSALKQYYAEYSDIFDLSAEEIPFPLSTSEEMLTDLRMRMKEDFPSIGETGLTIHSVSPALAPYSAPAYYMTAPIDDTDSNTIYINPEKTCPGLELYTTLAHEGFPGHLYQNTYTCKRIEAQDGSPAEALLWYGGYLEGWAMYAELLAFDYASDLYREHDLPDGAIYAQIEKHNRCLQLCLYSLLDIMIHYDGAAVSDISEYLSELGIRDADAINDIYTYICAEPCNYLKYYVGCLEFQELQRRAKELWNDSYSNLRFHTFCLEEGPADFETLRHILEETAIQTAP